VGLGNIQLIPNHLAQSVLSQPRCLQPCKLKNNMLSKSTGKGKGKGKGKAKARMPSHQDSVYIDLTTPSSSAEPVQLPSPISTPRPTQLPSFMSSSNGSSSSQPASSQGVKRKQTKITSFFPNKKGRIETIILAEDRKTARKRERKAKKEQEAAIKVANAKERTKQREAKKN
jgi:hypothetical protein